MPYHRHLALLGCVFALFSHLAMGGAVTSLESSVAIVYPEQASKTVLFATEELQRYLEAITGWDWPVQAESEVAPSYALYVGPCQASLGWADQTKDPVRTLQTESLVMAPDATGLHLLGGGDRGTLYAVYEFLELQGCRWFEPGPDGECIPSLDKIEIPQDAIVYHPKFAVRELGRGVSARDDAETLIDWSVKNRLNRNFGLRNNPAWIKRGGQVQWQHICHNSPWLVPNDPYFKTHPEYFSLFHGERLPQGKEGGYLCTTHPDVRRIVADYIINWFDTHPEGDAVPICPPDGDVKWCECEKCQALGGVNFMTGEEGHMTRRQVEFINAVADLVAEKYPDRYIVNLAYSRYVWPYEGMRTASNVINQVAHGYAGNGSMVHSIYSPRNKEARDIFTQWAESGGNGLGIWDYFLLQVPDQSGSPMTPLGFGRVAADMFTFLAGFPNPYKVYFTQAGSELQEYNPFLYYLVARLAWDPSQQLEALRTDYTQTRFGPAAAPVAEFLALLDTAYMEADWDPPIWREITVPSARVFTPEVLQQGWALLDKAQGLLDKENETGRDVLDRMRTSWSYVEAAVLPKQLIASEDGLWHLDRGQNAYVFNPGGEKNEDTWASIRARAQEQNLLDASMERVLFRCRSRSEPIIWLENERVKLGVLPGVGGRLIRLMDKRHGRNMFFEPFQLSELADPGATYFRYGGYEEYTRSAFASPGWELAMAPELQVTEEGSVLHMEAVTQENIRMIRTLKVGAGDDPYIHIESTLINEGDQPFEAMIRVHPEFQLTPTTEKTALLYIDAEGAVQGLPVSDVAGGGAVKPAGWWGLINLEDGQGLLHHFDPKEADNYIHLDRAYQTVNLELFGKKTLLQPGERCSLKQSYQLLSGPEEMSEEQRATWTRLRTPSHRPDRGVHYVPGQVGQAMRVGQGATPSYGGLSETLSKAGSFETWVQLDRTPSEEPDALIFSAGTRQPDYMVLAIRDGRLVFYRWQRIPGKQTKYKAWVKVDTALPEWTPGSWHHVVVNWARPETGFSMAELYVDGKCTLSRKDLNMVPFLETMSISTGWDSSNARRPRLAGALDQIRLYQQPLSPEAVSAAYNFGLSKTAYIAHPEPLLKLDFEGTLK